jgi:hypothetical protein
MKTILAISTGAALGVVGCFVAGWWYLRDVPK